jgi:hypothetical protein
MSIASSTQRHWFERSDDEKFYTLDELRSAAQLNKVNGRIQDVKSSDVRWIHDGNDLLLMNQVTKLVVKPTNWAFQQGCAMVGAHASYLSELPADLAAQCLNYNFRHLIADKTVDGKVIKGKNRTNELFYQAPVEEGLPELQSLTSNGFGRIWDVKLIDATMQMLEEATGKSRNFHSPLDWTQEKRALFRSDRDLHMLFIDGGSIVEGGGERDQLHRGFIIGNSQVGRGAQFFASFLFRWVCGNFAIHGLEELQVAKIRHTLNAPAKFAKEALPAMLAYVGASPKPLEDVIKKAKDRLLSKDEDEFYQFFRNRKFTGPEIDKAVLYAKKEEGDARTLWQMVNGFTRAANDIKHQDVATSLQKRAGDLLKLVA